MAREDTTKGMRQLLVTALLGALACGAIACEKKPGGATEGAGTIPITASSKGFEPSSVKLKKGAPATLVFTRTTDDTCATEVVFPELSVKKDLPKGVAVAISVPTEKEQTLTFQCGMGMYKSSVVVAAN
ncbi:MAG: cupredoxin domain-containing protein [Deltaproteobacteria bacterium]|nr:cupredoxin domain-containing protein [Deltaproteobacteria bacterium]